MRVLRRHGAAAVRALCEHRVTGSLAGRRLVADVHAGTVSPPDGGVEDPGLVTPGSDRGERGRAALRGPRAARTPPRSPPRWRDGTPRGTPLATRTAPRGGWPGSGRSHRTADR